MAKTSTMLLTTMAATGAGYIAGMLLAPKSGSELRSDIRGRAKMAAGKINGRIHQGKQKMQDKAETARRKMKEMTDAESGQTRNATAHPAT